MKNVVSIYIDIEESLLLLLNVHRATTQTWAVLFELQLLAARV